MGGQISGVKGQDRLIHNSLSFRLKVEGIRVRWFKKNNNNKNLCRYKLNGEEGSVIGAANRLSPLALQADSLDAREEQACLEAEHQNMLREVSGEAARVLLHSPPPLLSLPARKALDNGNSSF